MYFFITAFGKSFSLDSLSFLKHFDIVTSDVLHESATCFLVTLFLVIVAAKNIDPAAIEGAVLSSTKFSHIALTAINSAICFTSIDTGSGEQYLSIKFKGLL